MIEINIISKVKDKCKNMEDYACVFWNKLNYGIQRETHFPSYSNEYSNEWKGFVLVTPYFHPVLYSSLIYFKNIAVWKCQM